MVKLISLPYQKYKLLDCEINCHDMTISRGESTIQLPAKVFEFLKLLIENAGHTVTKEQAIEIVWHGNEAVGKRGTGNAIWHLRKTFTELNIEPDALFKTITKIGYQLLVVPEGSEPNTYSNANTSMAPDQHSLQNQTLVANNKKWTLVGGLIVLAALSMFIYKQMSHSEKPSQKLSIQAERITSFEGVEEQPSISPDGEYVAFQWRRERKKGQIFVQHLSKSDEPLRQITMSLEVEKSPSWSPDGQQLAYFRHIDTDHCQLHVRTLITNKDTVLANDCINPAYNIGLQWSPDGTKIAYTRKSGGDINIAYINIDTGEIIDVSRPENGQEDLTMAWSANSDQLVFVRAGEMIARLILTDLNGKTSVIHENAHMIIGLAWHHKTNQIYFNTLRDGAFYIDRLSLATGKIKEFHRDDTISSITIDQKQSQLIYAKHVAQEFITVRSFKDGHVIKQLTSSSRDLFGQAIPKDQGTLFASNRSGTWEIWHKGDAGNTQLTNKEGQLSIPVVSPLDDYYVMGFKRIEEDHFVLVKGSWDKPGITTILELDGDIRNPSFSTDGKRIYFSSNASGDWGIYRLDVDTNEAELLFEEKGKFAVEDDFGNLYYVSDHVDGIFYFDGTQHSLVVDSRFSTSDWGNLFVHDNQLHFLQRTDDEDVIVRLEKDNSYSTLFALPLLTIRNEKAFAHPVDGRLVITMLGINDADLYRVPLPTVD